MPIRYTTDDKRTTEQATADDRVRDDVEHSGGAWSQMTPEQRAQLRARVHEKKQLAEAARARKQTERQSLEDRVAALEVRVARLER
jgi:hypothetical protein